MHRHKKISVLLVAVSKKGWGVEKFVKISFLPWHVV